MKLPSHLLQAGALLAGLAATIHAQTFDLPARDAAVLRSDQHGNRALAVVDHQAEPRTLGLGLDPAWSPIGPFGGDVEDVAASPTAAGVVLAGLAPSGGSGGTLYRSTDDGASWSEVPGLAGTSVHDLEFAPDGTAWAGTIDGPYVSFDDGQTWTARPLGIGLNDQTFEVTIDPSDPDTLWVGVADALGNQVQNVLRSDDGGLNWTDRTPPGAAGQSCNAIAVDPGDPDEVFAAFGPAFGGGAVWASFDGGLTWSNRTSNLPTNPMNDLLHLGGEVFVCGGQAFGSQFVGLYRTVDGGLSWSAQHDGTWPSLVANDIELVAGPGGNVLWVATNTGPLVRNPLNGSWSAPFQALSLNEVSGHPSGSGEVFLGASSNAVWRGAPGTGFVPSSAGIGQLNVFAVDLDEGDPDRLAIAFQGLNDGGVYTSSDGGQLWSLEALPGTRFNDVAFRQDGTLYAISDGPTTVAPEAVYRRDPGGWVNLGPDQGTAFESELFVLEFGVGDPDLLIAGGSDFGVAGHEPTVWRSPDGGATWTKAYEGPDVFEEIVDVEPLRDGTDQVFVAGFRDLGSVQDGGVLRSVDGGASWQDASTGLPAGAQVESLDSDPLDPNVMLLADNDFGAGGLFRSADGGASWSLVNAVDRTLRVELHPLSGRVVHTAHFSGTRARRDEQGGATLDAFDTGLSAAGNVADLVLDPRGTRALLATSTGTWSRGLSLVVPYCVAFPNSAGAGATIGWSGSTSIGTNDLSLSCTGLPANQPGIFYYGPGQLVLPFGNGRRCVSAAGGFVVRLPVVQSNGAGGASFDVDQTQLTGIATIPPGSTRFFQYWYRDPAGGGAFFNLSDALAATFTP